MHNAQQMTFAIRHLSDTHDLKKWIKHHSYLIFPVDIYHGYPLSDHRSILTPLRTDFEYQGQSDLVTISTVGEI